MNLFELTNAQLIELYDNYVVWTTKSQKSFLDGIKSDVTTKQRWTSRQRYYFIKTLDKVICRKDKRSNFKEFRRNTYYKVM